MNTTPEIPEGSKATIQGKVIDGKNYLVIEDGLMVKDWGIWLYFWDDDIHHRAMIGVYEHFQGDYPIDNLGRIWDNAIKWDGTKEQYEKSVKGRNRIKSYTILIYI